MPYEDFLKLFCALLAGALIGAEREYRSKSAGLRTLTLICVGSALFTIVSTHVGNDAARIAANIVTGIGFLGAGIIFREDNRVRGLTTAATAWATAALGMSIGIGDYLNAMGGVLLILLILFSLVPLQNLIERKRQMRTYRIVFNRSDGDILHYEKLFGKFKLNAHRVKHSRVGSQITGQWAASGSAKNHEKFTNQMMENTDIQEFDF